MHAALASPPALFALDWGTSSLRAYALGPGGQVLATRRSEHGVMNLPAGAGIATPAEAFEAARVVIHPGQQELAPRSLDLVTDLVVDGLGRHVVDADEPGACRGLGEARLYPVRALQQVAQHEVVVGP